MARAEPGSGSWFERFLLPGLAFKGVVIGGGYATGREIAEFFLGSGPVGGLMGLVLAMAIWSAVCALTFVFAVAVGAQDYRTFFRALLGPFWILFEIVYVLLMILVLAVMAAAAGSIGEASLGAPAWTGTFALMAATIAVTTLGTATAERMFRYSSSVIYIVYAVFILLALAAFGDRVGPHLALAVPTTGWIAGGTTYAGYNLIGAVAVVPFLRHISRRRDAAIAGLVAGPLAMVPAIFFFLAMIAWYPEVGAATLPSDFLLQRIGAPWFAILFQLMIFCALLETGVGMVNALIERLDEALRGRGRRFPLAGRLGASALLVVGSGTIAAWFGLIDLIARGYGAFGYIMLVVFVLPLATIGLARLLRRDRPIPVLAAGDRP
ncbi:hypothetical protein C7I55_19185 [Sphingomonas deserti]|uniref:Membrane protein YkvI n=2 Tax=Allosphingosinicella deserti TaxID=2116704 RepID=A0A2P7QKR8_9SPHN|nr:hypothetical protein C7I55_19185 [Sphingomonas deserti]